MIQITELILIWRGIVNYIYRLLRYPALPNSIERHQQTNYNYFDIFSRSQEVTNPHSSKMPQSTEIVPLELPDSTRSKTSQVSNTTLTPDRSSSPSNLISKKTNSPLNTSNSTAKIQEEIEKLQKLIETRLVFRDLKALKSALHVSLKYPDLDTGKKIFHGALITLLGLMEDHKIFSSPSSARNSFLDQNAIIARVRTILTPAICLIFLPDTEVEKSSAFFSWIRNHLNTLDSNKIFEVIKRVHDKGLNDEEVILQLKKIMGKFEKMNSYLNFNRLTTELVLSVLKNPEKNYSKEILLLKDAVNYQLKISEDLRGKVDPQIQIDSVNDAQNALFIFATHERSEILNRVKESQPECYQADLQPWKSLEDLIVKRKSQAGAPS